MLWLLKWKRPILQEFLHMTKLYKWFFAQLDLLIIEACPINADFFWKKYFKCTSNKMRTKIIFRNHLKNVKGQRYLTISGCPPQHHVHNKYLVFKRWTLFLVCDLVWTAGQITLIFLCLHLQIFYQPNMLVMVPVYLLRY